MRKILRIFYHYLLKKRIWASIFFVLILVEPFLSAIQPIFYKLFVDRISLFDSAKLLEVLYVYIGVRVLDNVFSMASYYVGDVLMLDAVAEVRKDAVKHIQDLDFAYHAKKSSGSLVSKINRGVGAFWDFHQSIHFQLAGVLINFIVMLYFFRSLDMKIFFLAIASLIAALFVTKVFISQNIKTRRRLNKMDDRITAITVDNMVNFETVKVFAKELFERRRLKNELLSWVKSAWDFVLTFRLLDIGMGVLINLSVFLMLLVSINLTIKGEFSAGNFVLVIGFIGTFYPRLFDLVYGVRRIAQNYTDIEKLFEILEQKVEVKDFKNSLKLRGISGEVGFKNVNFSYEKKKTNVVKNINLKISPGESVALVGRSGAGKTTIVKLLMRFYDVDGGEITIDGVNIKRLKKSDLRGYMGVVPQEPILFNNSIGYNIAYGKTDATKAEIVAASKIARIHDFIETLPSKYNSKVGERGIKLSGGQKQRVAIARMILSDPRIIIFDEATSQLDSESERLIQEAFWKASEGKTTIIIAHRLSTVMRADKIVVMDKGRIVEVGTHRELVSGDTLYKKFWDLQIKLN